MGQMSKVSGVATSIRTDDAGVTHVRYHQTDVASFDGESVTLRNGGWWTATTKARINQAAAQFNLGFRLTQKSGAWIVWFPGTDRPQLNFRDGMTFPILPDAPDVLGLVGPTPDVQSGELWV